MNHLSENIDLYSTVFTELKSIGVKVPKVKSFKSCVQKPGKKSPSLNCKMFGISLYKQEWTYDFDYPLPKFLAMSTTYLLNYTKTLGLFRKSGSLVRQRSLRVNLEKGETIEGSDPNDVASLIKLWLRELPEPLIPFYMQDLFVRCQQLVNKQDSASASLLCCLLLPPDHLHPFKHLMCFLKKIAADCSENKMGAHNLALMMAPNIFISKAESISKPSSILIQLHTSVIELLIENSDDIGKVPQSVSLKYSIPSGSKATELASSGMALDYSPSKITKKIRNDFVGGIKKLVGQNSALSSGTSDKHWDSPKIGCRSVLSNNTEELFSTPLRVKDKQSAKPKTVINHTRRKSFGLLRKKDITRKTSSKRNSFTKQNQAMPRRNSSSRSVSKRNSNSKAQNSGSGSACSQECSDSSSPQNSLKDEFCQSKCELFSNNEEEIRKHDVGNLDLKIEREELKVKDIDSNYKIDNNFNNSLNRSMSFNGDPRWKSNYASTKTPKKSVRSSSLIRGKPNTVKSGLPYQRFYRDLVLAPKTIEVKNKSENEANRQFTPIKLNETSKKSEEFSLEPKISLVSISSVHNSPVSNDNNESVRILSLISPTAVKDSLNTLSLKNRGRLSLPLSRRDRSCSSSKIPRFDYSVDKKTLNSVEKKSLSLERSEHSKIPLFQTTSASDGDASISDSLFYTPKQTMQTECNSTIWMSSNQFFESETPQTETNNKRESIAMILRNKTGHVQAKVQLYNSREMKSCPIPGSTPATYQSTPCRRSYSQRQVPSSKNLKPLSVLQRCESSKQRVKGKAKGKTPLKPLSESKASDLELTANYPLKEVTNMNLDGKQNVNSESTPIAGKKGNVNKVCSDNVLNRSIIKRDSFAGQTPAELSKRVCRSESSPNCPRPGSRLFKTPSCSTVVNRGMKIERHSSFSPVIPCSSIKMTDSSLSNPKLEHGNIIDEWHCDI